MRAAGLGPIFDMVLFDDDVSDSYEGAHGITRLTNGTFISIDVSARLYDYHSQICRTSLPAFAERPTSEEGHQSFSLELQRKLKIWKIVFEAQTASLAAMHENSTAADVAIAARKVIGNAGHGDAATHRVSHGIGTKAYESPFLHRGNVDVILKASMTLVSKPGLYLEGNLAVICGDALLVKAHGEPDVLSEKRAFGPWDPCRCESI